MKPFSTLIKSVAFTIMPFLAISASEGTTAKIQKPHTFEITPELSKFNYGPKFLGLGGKYRYSFDQSYVELDLGYAYSSCAKRNKYRMMGLFGHHFILNDDFMLTPYLGLGYRRDTFARSSWLKDFKFSAVTLPIGCTLAYTMDDKTTLKFNAEYEYYLQNHINIHRGNKFNRRTRSVVRLSSNIHAMKFQPSIERSFDSLNIEAKPYIRYTSLSRPGFSGSREIGFGLGFKY
ncbi:MAG: hypothetical protein Q8L85_00400 [Alphaproteobacteria bacterium]|nr:hypothetical protein [Alphaproteobacteria bacterium]